MSRRCQLRVGSLPRARPLAAWHPAVPSRRTDPLSGLRLSAAGLARGRLLTLQGPADGRRQPGCEPDGVVWNGSLQQATRDGHFCGRASAVPCFLCDPVTVAPEDPNLAGEHFPHGIAVSQERSTHAASSSEPARKVGRACVLSAIITHGRLGAVKVALLSDCYLPRLGGIEVQVHDLAAQLRVHGHEVEIFTATPGPRAERHGVVEMVNGTPVHRMALGLPWELPVNPLAPPEVRRRLEAGAFDMAHVHMGVVSPFATDMAQVCLRAGLPTAITWHCLMGNWKPVLNRLGHARRWAEAGAALSAVSSVTAESVGALIGEGADVRVLPNGINVAEWAPPMPRTRTPGRPVRIVAAMRLAARKRPKAVLDVVARARELLPSGTPLQLDLLGEGPQRGRLERYVSARGLAGVVRLPGRATREGLRQRYDGADIYLCTASLEAFGIAALEARTAGLPVIARRDTGVADFILHGVNGFLAEDDEEMASLLAGLVLDEPLRLSIAHHNATAAPEQSWPSVVKLTEDEYERAARHCRVPAH